MDGREHPNLPWRNSKMFRGDGIAFKTLDTFEHKHNAKIKNQLSALAERHGWYRTHLLSGQLHNIKKTHPVLEYQ